MNNNKNTIAFYKEIIKEEKKLYFYNLKHKIKLKLSNDERYFIWKYLFFLRKREIYGLKKNIFSKLLKSFYRRKVNKLGNKMNIRINPYYSLGCVNIYHKNVIINGKIGSNCVFHGNNCLGNKMNSEGIEEIPSVGDEVDFGYGAIAIGNVHIASGVVIGAGAVVVSDINEERAIYAGVPAKRIKK